MIGFLIAGLIIGALARLIVPGRQRLSVLATLGLGLVGSLIGGFGYRFSRNTRLTVFDTAKRDEGRVQHTFSTSFLFAL